MTATDLTAEDVVWDLAPLLPEPGEAGVKRCSTEADAIADELAEARGQVAEFDADAARRVHARGSPSSTTSSAGPATTPGLDFSADTTDPARGALMQHVEERATAIATTLLFFELEWAAVADEQADALLADDRLAFAAHHLRSARRYRPHLLIRARRGRAHREVGDRSQRVAAAVRGAGLGDHRRRSTATTIPLEAGLAQLHSPDRAVRQAAAEAVTAGLAPNLRTRAFVLNTLLADKATDDRLRHYDSWIASRNLANEASDESVQALVDAVQGRYAIPQRWYALKAQLLGLDTHRRLRPHGVGRRHRVARSAGTKRPTIVLDAYASFSPELADTARRFFDGWIDARRAPGQATGRVLRVHGAVAPPVRAAELDRRAAATCSRSRTSSATACTRTSRVRRACSTRRRRSRSRRPRRCSARPSRSAGCSSVIDDPQERLALLASNLEDQIATVFRQTAMNRFEDAIHTGAPRRRRAVDRALRRAVGADADRHARRRGRAHRGLPHVVVVHPALHRHARLRVRVRVRPAARAVGVRALRGGRAPTSCRSTSTCCAPAARWRPRSSASIVGVDLADPEFWDRGLDIVERRLDETEQAARDAGRI